MYLSSASFAYPQLDGFARAAVAGVLTEADRPVDTFVLSTCLRVEVAVPGDEVALKRSLGALLGAAPVEPIIRHDGEAGSHLFRVAAGLESPIIGEIEVLTQFRSALAAMKEAGALDGGFVKLLEAAVATGREGRSRLDSSPHDTMAAIAAQVVGAFPEVAVLGSGTMAAAVVAALEALPAPPRLVVLARAPERAVFPGVEVRSIDDLASALATFPAVVSATAAATELLDAHDLGTAVKGRRNRLTLVDMAMPPDFSPEPDASIDYVGIDDLAAMAWRRHRGGEIEEMVNHAASAAYHRFSGNHQVAPVIARLLERADAAVDETVERFAGRLADESDRQVLRQAVHTVARTILSRPLNAVRSSRDTRMVEAIAAAFDDE